MNIVIDTPDGLAVAVESLVWAMAVAAWMGVVAFACYLLAKVWP